MADTTERETNVYMAKVAEQAERYDEMVSHMKDITKHHVPLTLEERNLLSVAFKNLIGARRAAWRIVSSIEEKEISNNRENRVENLKVYRAKIEMELHKTCADIFHILDDEVIPFVDATDKNECLVFYYKMKADYYRYVAEITKDDERKKASDTAEGLYREATDLASDLDHTHPIRLGLALNYSVFYYEILSNAEKACDIAKGAMDNAIALLESEEVQNSAHDYRDSVLIIQLLKDNFTLWGENQQE
ncbi:MAG: 14-3-3 domain-containing protein [Linnemannia elongata]|nr:MAG: 14-3-3 domain-containing protein [Linnemannia elongata]